MNPGNLLPRDSPARRPVTRAPGDPALDRASQLVHARGDATLAAVERALAREGLGLGLADGAPRDETLAAWIANGARGAPSPWIDPVEHVVAGFTAALPSGAELEVRPSPRRAVGPDLFALFLGARERVGAITGVHLRARGPSPARPLAVKLDADPPATSGEEGWIGRAFDAARNVT
jgi:alkyldihydroxyacetonephosphate synthase